MSKQIRILFYIPSLPQEFGGVRQYAAGLMKLFSHLEEDFQFFIYHDGEDPNIIHILNSSPRLVWVKPGADQVSKVQSLGYSFGYYGVKIWNRLVKKDWVFEKKTDLDVVVSRYKIDIVHCPYQLLPEITAHAGRRVRRFITMHDVQELHFPEFFSAKDRALRAVNFLNYIENADRVIVSYRHVKEDIIRFFDKPEEDLTILLLRMDNLWFKKFENSQLPPSPSSEPYLFYPANFWKHKNHRALIEAVYQLKKTGKASVNLVLTGDSATPEGMVVKQLIQDYGLESQVRMLGIVDEKTLYSIYQNARGVVVPTCYEAGSFPLMESILMEIPVICSNVTSLPETIGDERFIFDPFSEANMAAKIEEFWNNEDFRKEAQAQTKKQQARLIDTNADLILREIYSES